MPCRGIFFFNDINRISSDLHYKNLLQQSVQTVVIRNIQRNLFKIDEIIEISQK